jgi:hypothetical protein
LLKLPPFLKKRIKGYDKSGNIAYSSKYLAGEREREREQITSLMPEKANN